MRKLKNPHVIDYQNQSILINYRKKKRYRTKDKANNQALRTQLDW